MFDPSGLTLRLSEAHPAPGVPDELVQVFDTYLNPAIRLDQFNLIVRLDSFPAGTPSPDSPMTAWIVQATPGPGSGDLPEYVPASALPSYHGVAQPRAIGCPAGAHCYDIHTLTTSPSDQLDLYVPGNGGANCPCVKLSIVASVTITLAGGSRAAISVQGGLPERDADEARVVVDGQETTLGRIFRNAGLPLNNDTNYDGVADAWNLQFQGNAERVELGGEDPSSKIGVRPPGCD